MKELAILAFAALVVAPAVYSEEPLTREAMRSIDDIAREFRYIDINKDGYLSESEIHHSERAARGLSSFDQNGDDQVEFAEFATFQEPMQSETNPSTTPESPQTSNK